MAEKSLEYSNLFAKGLPPATGRWNGHPPFNFIGGHADPDLQPIEEFVESSARAFRKDGRGLATYNMDSGPQGYLPLREFVAEKLARHRGIQVSTDEVLITSGSGQGISLINDVLLESGDTVITELYSFAGVLSNLRRRQVNIVGIDTDSGGMRMDFLASALEDLHQRGITPKYIYTIPTLQNPTGTVMRLITSGSGQGISLINDVLLESGDTVITELYSFAGVLSNLRRRQVNIVGIDTDSGGMRMDFLASALEDLHQRGITPKYIYTIPTLQNPTGTVMSMERRREMLRLSREYGVPIFEDECYADLIFEGEWEHAIRSLDDANHVLHIGSFSKSLAPAIRLGYAVAPWEVLSQLLACKGDGGTGAMEKEPMCST